MKYLISGAKGWLGQATIRVLRNEFGIACEDIVGIGHENQELLLGREGSIRVLTWDEIAAIKVRPITFFHFAFVTRDKLANLGFDKYVELNRHIIRNAEELILAKSPEKIISVSSGAVYSDFESEALTKGLRENPYGVLKLEEEDILSDAAEKVNATLITNRLWNLSGQDIQNTHPFVLASFILAALRNREITIEANFHVFRRYVDARELILLLIMLAERRDSITFDSGGPLIEIRELAREVINQTGTDVRIIDPGVSGINSDNRYYSKSNSYDNFCVDILHKPPLNIEEQVRNTILGLRNKL